MTPQKLGWMPSQLVPKRGYELSPAAGIQVSRAYSQPQTEREGHREIQQAGRRKTEQGPENVAPGQGAGPGERAHIISERCAGQGDVPTLDRHAGEDAYQRKQTK